MLEIKTIFGKVLFTYTNENATIKGALQQAIKEKIDLRGANLSGVDLRGADLRGADLMEANLRGADLRGVDLPIFCKWSHSIKDNLIQIVCKEMNIKDWDTFFESDEVYETKRNTKEFKQIQAVYEAYKAYLTFLNK